MSTKMFILACSVLIVSIFANVAMGFNLTSQSQESKQEVSSSQDLKQQVKKLKEDLRKAEGIIREKKLTDNEEYRKVINDFFSAQYNFDTKAYKERFNKIKPLVNKEVYGQLTSAGLPDVPNIKFENHIENMEIYITPGDREINSLVLIDTIYQVEGVKSQPTTQVFEVKVSNIKGKKQIAALKTIGSFASMTNS